MMSKLHILNQRKTQIVTRPVREFNTISGEEEGNYYRVWYNSLINSLFTDKTEGFVKFRYSGGYTEPFDFKIYDDNDIIHPNTHIPYGKEIRFEKKYLPSQKPRGRQMIASFLAIYCPQEGVEEIIQPFIWKYF